MTQYFEKDGVCYGALGGRIPAGARAVPAPFAPLVLCVDRDPAVCRGLFAAETPGEVLEAEGPSLLLPPPAGSVDPQADAVIARDGAAVLNTAFARAFPVWERFRRPKTEGLRLTLVGLGDVGGAILTGLVLLGESIAEIGVYDAYAPLMERYRLELNQVLPTRDGRTMPRIVPRSPETLFDCDVFLFAATAGVPPVGSAVADVRMAQLEANGRLVARYARQAREAGFSGLFCEISDPVDQLARRAFLESNRAADGTLDFAGLLPEQVQGFGLGVMAARARFAARERGLPEEPVTVFGPHGRRLVAANDPGAGYDEALSQALTEAAATANLAVRELGFKPYIAPGLSSAAISILALLAGRYHHGAVALDGAYLGCRSRLTPRGLQLLRRPLHPRLFDRVAAAHQALREDGHG